MKRIAAMLFTLFGVLATTGLRAEGSDKDLTYIKNRKRLPDVAYQAELRHQKSWQQFLASNGTWYVVFNEETGKPHRAYGKPIVVAGQNPTERALNFIATQLTDFSIDVSQLHALKGNAALLSTAKHDHANFYQKYQGLKVENSRVTVKMDKQGRVIMWGADVYDNINLSVVPQLSAVAVMDLAKLGITGVSSAEVQTALSVLPLPGNKSSEYRLVYTVFVMADEQGIPARYYTLIDANSGEVLYRQNQVKNHKPAEKPIAAASLKVQGTVSDDNPSVAANKKGLANLKVIVDGTVYYTNDEGNIDFDLTGAGSTNISLSGKWVEVHNQSNGGAVPGVNTVVTPGSNTADLDFIASLEERSAYFNTNIIHDFQKTVLTNFTGMDKMLPANVDISPATCNAFYNGTSINFYLSSSTCYSLANVADVIYHEYGHGINDEFYTDLGSFFNNGAMGEGYADVWAFAVHNDPVLGNGMNPTDPSEFVRRYDQEPKVYPNDIVGEVHADGEIIAGAWWDVFKNLGDDMPLTMAIFAEAYVGLQAEAPDGDEGTAYTDVLLDALQADDNDANLSNGTPHGAEIAAAFRRHGITLISNAEIVHEAILTANGGQDITINAELILDNQFEPYLQGVSVYYATNKNNSWIEIPLTTVNNVNYTGVIPAVASGTLVKYYLGVKDNFGNLGVVSPIASNLDDPNVPNYILAGFNFIKVDDLDDNYANFGEWFEGVSDDNATTGRWEFAIPIGSFSSPGDESTAVAPYYQTTPNGNYCFVTQNSSSESAGLGERDVDAGKTTLQTPVMNLSSYTNPTFTYNRWYTNNPPSGANPNADYWMVMITNDGVNWKYVESTMTSDRSWRRVAFRVRDYLEATNSVQLRFIASDSLRPGQNLNGGSLVEAALDDLTLYNADSYTTQIVKNGGSEAGINLFPNPSNGDIQLLLKANSESLVDLVVTNMVGATIYRQQVKNLVDGINNISMPLECLSNGVYTLNIMLDGSSTVKKFSILH